MASTNQSGVADESTPRAWTTSGEAANGYQKAGAPVSLAHKAPVSALAHSSVTVPLRYTSRVDLDSLLISYSGGDALQLVGAASDSMDALRAGEAVDVSIPVVVNAQGGGTLNIYVTVVRTVGAEVFETSRAFSVSVGEQVPEKAGPPVITGEDGKTYQTVNF